MWQSEMVEKLKAASPRDRRGILQSHAEMTGYKLLYLYEVARECGFESGRKKRSDTGECMLTDDQIDFVAALIYTTGRQDKGVIMPIERALEIAIDNGIIDKGLISVGRMQQLLRERQINKEALDAENPHTPMRSLHPNHVHFVDPSFCIQYYLRNGQSKIYSRTDFYKQRPSDADKVKTHLMRYVLTDHFSGAIFVYYYDTSGESSNNLYDFLLRSWEFKKDGRYPFRGVPFQLMMDQGSANTSKAVLAFLERLGVVVPDGMPGNPHRQGSVETAQHIVERWFESALRIQPAHTVEDLNAWALDWCTYHCANKKHTRHGMSRTDAWMLIKKEQLRELPDREILQELYAYDDEKNTRLVSGDYSISFALKGENKRYYLKHIPGILPTRSKVLVRIKPFVWPTVDIVFNDIAYEVAPLEMLPAIQGGFRADAAIIGQEYKAQPESLTQQTIKRINDIAYGENASSGSEARPFPGLQVMGHHADKLGNLEYMPRRGNPIEIDRESLEKNIPFVELLKRLEAAGVEITPKIHRELRDQYGESIDSKIAEEVIAQMRNKIPLHPPLAKGDGRGICGMKTRKERDCRKRCSITV